MATRRTSTVFTRVDPAMHQKIKDLLVQGGLTQDQFVFEAIVEKMERVGQPALTISAEERRLLDRIKELDGPDKVRVESLIDLLRQAPDGIKRAADMACSLLHTTLKEWNELGNG